MTAGVDADTTHVAAGVVASDPDAVAAIVIVASKRGVVGRGGRRNDSIRIGRVDGLNRYSVLAISACRNQGRIFKLWTFPNNFSASYSLIRLIGPDSRLPISMRNRSLQIRRRWRFLLRRAMRQTRQLAPLTV